VKTYACVRTLGASALPHMHVASCTSCSALGPVHLHPPSSAAHSTGAWGHTSSWPLSDPLCMLLEQWRHLAGKVAIVCSALSARIDVLGRPWRHTGHFGPGTARTRDAHEVPSPSPASEHNRCPLVHCSMRPCGASVSRIRVRPHQALSHMITPWRGERRGVPTTVRLYKDAGVRESWCNGKEFNNPKNLCSLKYGTLIPLGLGSRARGGTRCLPSPRHTTHFR